MKQVEYISNSLVQHSVKSNITKNSLCVNANNPTCQSICRLFNKTDIFMDFLKFLIKFSGTLK